MPATVTTRANASTLWLALQRPRMAWAGCALLFMVYVASMSRDLGLFDSAELALVAVQLGLGHPIGQPLHTLLGFVFAHVPLLPPLFGLNLLSAVCGALCVIPAAAIAERLGGDEAATATPAAVLHAALFSAGMHAIVWEPATRIEVYALGAVLTLWSIAHAWQALEAGSPSARRMLAAGAGFGLAACANPYTALIGALSLAPWLLTALLRRELSWRALSGAAVGGILGLAPYAYVPWVSQRRGVLIWGAPTNKAALVHYFSGADFQHNRSITAHEWLAHMLSWFGWSAQQWLLLVLLVGAGGYLAGERLQRALLPALALLLTVALIGSNLVFSPDVPDYFGYLLLPVWLCSAGAAAFAALIGTRARRSISYLMLAVLVLSSLLSSPSWFARTRARDHFAREFASAALRAAPQRAIVVAQTDQLVAAALYLQLVEHERPDVVILAAGLANSSWYWEQLFARHGDLRSIPLRGPGGRDGRMRRLFDANPERAVLFEYLELARDTQMTACNGGYLLRSGSACAVARAPDMTPARLFRRSLATVGSGSPSSVSAIAMASFALGQALFELGERDASVEMLLSGVPQALQPSGVTANPPAQPSPASQQRLLVPEWRRSAALGDPARNLFFAGLISAQAGRSQLAAALVAHAAADGLPEAIDLLERATP